MKYSDTPNNMTQPDSSGPDHLRSWPGPPVMYLDVQVLHKMSRNGMFVHKTTYIPKYKPIREELVHNSKFMKNIQNSLECLTLHPTKIVVLYLYSREIL